MNVKPLVAVDNSSTLDKLQSTAFLQQLHTAVTDLLVQGGNDPRCFDIDAIISDAGYKHGCVVQDFKRMRIDSREKYFYCIHEIAKKYGMTDGAVRSIVARSKVLRKRRKRRKANKNAGR